MNLAGPDVIVILLIILVLFGAKKLPTCSWNPQGNEIIPLLQMTNIKDTIHYQADRHIGTVVPHAGQRGLNHELVRSMATGHKTKRRLHLHNTRADSLRSAFSRDKTHSR